MAFVKYQLTAPQVEDANGDPLVGGSITAYLWDTSTPTPMYTNAAGDGADTSFMLNTLGNPQTDAGTAIDIFLDTAITYKFIIRDSEGTQVGPTIGPVYPAGGTGQTAEFASLEEFRASSFSGSEAVILAANAGTTTGRMILKATGTSAGTPTLTAARFTALAGGEIINEGGYGFALDAHTERTPLMFGAAGDGIADDTAPVLLSIASDAITVLPIGYTFLVTGVEKTGLTNFRITGMGALKLAGASNKPPLRLVACTQFSVDRIEIDGNGAAQTETVNRNLGAGISLSQCADYSVAENYVHNNYSGAAILAIDNGSTATELPTNGYIVRNRIKNAGLVGGPLLSDGIYANSDNTLVADNFIEDCTDYGIAGDYSYKLKVSRNEIKNVLVGIGVLGAFNWDVTGNTIDGAAQGIAVTLSGNPATAPYISDGVLIGSNTILNITRAGSGTPNGDGVFVDPSATNVRVMQNTIRNVYRGVGASNPNCIVIGNNVDTTLDRGIFCSGAGSIVANNKVINTTGSKYYLGSNPSLVTFIGDGVADIRTVSAFLNGWSNAGGAYGSAQYYEMAGRVHLSGSVVGGTTTAGTPLFVLPAGYRPSVTMEFAVADADALGILRIDTSGNVIIRAGTGTRMTLDGISFIVRA